MKAIVSDVNILSHLEPQKIELYLQATGWHERNRIPDKVSIWTRDTFCEDKLKIQLPVDQDFDDYPDRMYEIMEILEKAENRSQLDILSDLITNWENVSLQGVVIQIQHLSKDIGIGRVILLGVVVDKLRKIHTHLSEPDYTLAIKAYQEHLPIICNGDLIKEDNIFILKNPHGFTLDELREN